MDARRSSRAPDGFSRSRSVTPRATFPDRVICPMRWRGRCGRHWRSTTATSWRSCLAWRRSAATQSALEGCGARCCRCMAICPGGPGSRAPAGGRAAGGAGDLDRRDSLTVPGVRIVVDGGWRRAPRLDPSTGLTRLATVRISRRRPSSEQAAPDARRRGSPSGCGPPRCIAEWRRSIGRKSSRRNSRRWCSTAPPGARAPAALAFLDPPPQGAFAAAGCVAGGTWRSRRRRVHHRNRPPDGGTRGASQARRHDAGGDDSPPRRRSPQISPHCWRNATRCADPEAPAEIGSRLAAIAHGDPAADRGALARIRRVAAQYRRRLRDPDADPQTAMPARLLAAGVPRSDRAAPR